MKSDKKSFAFGDLVRVNNGPFMGIEGTVCKLKNGANKIMLSVEMVGGQTVSITCDANEISLVSSLKDIIRKELEVAVKPITAKLIYDLGRKPEELYALSCRDFEELVAELLSDMGYGVHLTPQTRDGGRDILAYMDLPHGKVLTIVDCKRFSQHRRIGPDIIERLMWVAQQKDHASQAMIATTSFFTSGARELEREYKWQLCLKDFDSMQDWLSKYGTWKREEAGQLWLPKERFVNDLKPPPKEVPLIRHT